MGKKTFKRGLIIGRFAPIQIGHEKLINIGLEFCESTLVLVGSAQESGTLRNPYDIETRIDIIKKSHPEIPEDVLMIRGIKDLKNELNNDLSWGNYVKSEVIRHQGHFSDLAIYGNDSVKRSWFKSNELAELYVPRDEISATYVRGLMLINDELEWQKTTAPLIHNMYNELRRKLINVPVYRYIYNSIRSDLTIEAFMKLYSKLEEDDRRKKLADLQVELGGKYHEA